MEMYKTESGLFIRKIDVVRKTENSIWILDWRGKERREAISTNYNQYFETFQAAKDFVVRRALLRMESARISFNSAEKEYEKSLLIEDETK